MSNEPTTDLQNDAQNQGDIDDKSHARDKVERELDKYATELRRGDVALDMVTGRPLYVIERVAGDAVEYYQDQDGNFDLTTYKVHPWLPVTPDDAVFACVFIPTKLQDIPERPEKGKVYDYPRGRLARVPIEHLFGSDSHLHNGEPSRAWLEDSLGDMGGKRTVEPEGQDGHYKVNVSYVEPDEGGDGND